VGSWFCLAVAAWLPLIESSLSGISHRLLKLHPKHFTYRSEHTLACRTIHASGAIFHVDASSSGVKLPILIVECHFSRNCSERYFYMDDKDL
jgi:hypothetical protein